MGAFYYAKNFGNFGRETNGTWKFSVQSGPPPQGSSFSPVGLLYPKLAVPFPKFSFPALLC